MPGIGNLNPGHTPIDMMASKAEGKQNEKRPDIDDLPFLKWPIAKSIGEITRLHIGSKQAPNGAVDLKSYLVEFILDGQKVNGEKTETAKEHDVLGIMKQAGRRLDVFQERPLNREEAEQLADHAIKLASQLLLPEAESTQVFDPNKHDIEKFDISQNKWNRLAEAARKGDRQKVTSLVELTLFDCTPEEEAWVVEYFMDQFQPEKAVEAEQAPYDWDRYDIEELGIAQKTLSDLIDAAKEGDFGQVSYILDEDLRGSLDADQRHWVAQRLERWSRGERPPAE